MPLASGMVARMELYNRSRRGRQRSRYARCMGNGPRPGSTHCQFRQAASNAAKRPDGDAPAQPMARGEMAPVFAMDGAGLGEGELRLALESENLQIDVTSRCQNTCSSCHHLCGNFPKQWDMTVEQFKRAVDSCEGFHSISLMGGDPVLNPYFEEFCLYLQEKVKRESCGLYTCFPPGKEHYRELIVKTFGRVFLNDHSRPDILHAPILVASEEMPFEPWVKAARIWRCWIQETWSFSVNPMGCWFCETAGSLAMLFNDGATAWPVEPGWWKRSPFEFKEQSDRWCKLCGAAFPMMKRPSVEGVDDVSPGMLKRLQEIGSPKIKAGKYVVHDMKTFQEDCRPKETYKDGAFRNQIAARYGIWLSTVPPGYSEPHLLRNWEKPTC